MRPAGSATPFSPGGWIAKMLFPSRTTATTPSVLLGEWIQRHSVQDTRSIPSSKSTARCNADRHMGQNEKRREGITLSGYSMHRRSLS
jgi:hypothetical protein